jgi:hypothetical protein
MSIQEFGKGMQSIDNPQGELYFKDNGSDILAVAHLDVVGSQRPKWSRSKFTIQCEQLDDRLGAWNILDYLPTMGLEYDILLTDCEEIGKSTAQYFNSDKQYNWVFEFDRAGTDCVLYDYHHSAIHQPVEEFFPINYGAFSDISYLGHLGCGAMNIGVGYHRQHSPNCYALLSDTISQADIFREFYQKYSDTHFPFVESPWDNSDYSYQPYQYEYVDGEVVEIEYDIYDDDNSERCDICGEWKESEWYAGDIKSYVCADCVRNYELSDTTVY